jgi:NAD-dependent dihydropyrimidine dehydrogenase PreA subunit
MAIERIDENQCNGCGICVNSCPMDVIRMDEERKKAIAIYPEDCTLCAVCEIDCPQHAIYVSPIKQVPVPMCWGL